MVTISSFLIKKSKTTVSQDVQTRFSVQLAIAKFLSIPFAGLFPPSEIQFPLTENQFPLTEIQFPLTENQFPLTEIQFPLTENKISYNL